MTEDPMSMFAGLESCSDCGTLQTSDNLRCPECGRFHSSTLVRPELTVEQARAEARERVDRPPDPSHYSLDPTGNLPEESTDSNASSVSKPWQGGVTDFTFEEE